MVHPLSCRLSPLDFYECLLLFPAPFNFSPFGDGATPLTSPFSRPSSTTPSANMSLPTLLSRLSTSVASPCFPSLPSPSLYLYLYLFPSRLRPRPRPGFPHLHPQPPQVPLSAVPTTRCCPSPPIHRVSCANRSIMNSQRAACARSNAIQGSRRVGRRADSARWKTINTLWFSQPVTFPRMAPLLILPTI